MNRRTFLSSLACLSTAPFLSPHRVFAAVDSNGGVWTERRRPMMGTFVSVAIFSHCETEAARNIDECFASMEQQVSCISEWQAESVISKLNYGEPLSATDYDGTSGELLKVINTVSQLSRGAYASLPSAITTLWRDARTQGVVPDRMDVAYALRKVQRSSLVDAGSSYRISGASGVDTGGVGEGFIAQRGCAFLKTRGVRYARIDCGGDISFLGDTEWRVEIEDPRSENFLGSVAVWGNVGISTSGDYRNCWFVNGKRYHHLLDMTTGFPTQHVQQVTVVHPNAALADGLATGLSGFPAAKAIDILKRVPGATGIVVDQNHKVHITPGVSFISS